MTGTLTSAVAAPTGKGRGRRPFRAPVVAAVVWLAVSLVTVGLLWAAIISFDTTLTFTSGWLVVARIVEVAAAVAGLSVPLAAVRGLRAALHASALAREGNVEDARVAADDAKQAAWYVVGFGLAFLVLAFLFWFFGANDGAIRDKLFNWRFPLGKWEDLLRGFWINIKIFMVAEVIILVWALVVAVVRMIPGRAGAPLRALAIIYSDLFRGIPTILVLYIVVFGFPIAGVPPFSSMGRESQLFWLSVLAFSLTYGAYVSEVYRAGLDSIHWSQTAAARSLGLGHVQTLRYVIVPQAVRRITPPLLNDFIGLQKDTALVSVVGVLDIVNRANIYKGQDFNLTYLTGAAVCFLIITVPLTRFTDFLIKRDQARMRAGG